MVKTTFTSQDLHEIFQRVNTRLKKRQYRGNDPYDLLANRAYEYLPHKLQVALTHVNRLSPVNLRPVLAIPPAYNTKAMALLLKAYANMQSPDAEGIADWLEENSLDWRGRKCFSFAVGVALRNYQGGKKEPNLIISLFATEALMAYDRERYGQYGRDLAEMIIWDLPFREEGKALHYSYLFNQYLEVPNSTAEVGKFFARMYEMEQQEIYLTQVERILAYLRRKQRGDGSWAYYGEGGYTDNYHTGFILKAIREMLPLDELADNVVMYRKGMEFYRRELFDREGQPRHYAPNYTPEDIRSRLISTDIRDSAVAVGLLPKEQSYRTLNWTLENMYNRNKGYFYFYRRASSANRIEHIRPQAWMLNAISEVIRNDTIVKQDGRHG